VNYLRSKMMGLLRKASGLSDPSQIADLDAEGIFEELAHSHKFLRLCRECSTLLCSLVDGHYRKLADEHPQASDVIHPELLPSDEALKLLAD